MTTTLRIQTGTLLVACSVLLAIWPLPDTMAVRHLMLLLGTAATVGLLCKDWALRKPRGAWPAFILLAFFLWLLFHHLALATDPSAQWRELTGDWLRTFLASLMGLGLGYLLSERFPQQPGDSASRRTLWLILGLSGTVVIYNIRYLYEVYTTGQWIHKNFFMAPYLGKTALVIFGSLFLPVLFIKVLHAARGHARLIWLAWSLAGIMLTLSGYYFSNTKNGFAIFTLLLLLFVCKLLYRQQQPAPSAKNYFTVTVCLLLAGFTIKQHLESNPAWSNLVADFKISVQIDRSTNWKDRISPLPINQNGHTVDGSTYERVSWGRAGLELLSEHPLGYGLINHSFGALAKLKWPDYVRAADASPGATHSGWLDFGLGMGLPGLLLVWMSLLVSYVRSRRTHGFWAEYATWAIPTIAFTYLTTEVCTDHFVELLFFMCAWFCGLTLNPVKTATGADVDLT